MPILTICSRTNPILYPFSGLKKNKLEMFLLRSPVFYILCEVSCSLPQVSCLCLLLCNGIFRLQKEKQCLIKAVYAGDVTAAILVFQNNETVAMLVHQSNPVGVEFNDPYLTM